MEHKFIEAPMEGRFCVSRMVNHGNTIDGKAEVPATGQSVQIIMNSE